MTSILPYHKENSIHGLFLGQEIIRELSSLCDKEEWTSLVTRCFEILSIDEDMPLVWNFLGLAQRANGMPRLAEVSHKHAIALDPNFYA